MMPAVESLPAAFAATAHRHRPVTAVRAPGGTTSWLRLAEEVRALALGLAVERGAGRGRRIAVRGSDDAERVGLELAVVATGAAVVVDDDADVAVEPPDLASLRAAGREVDGAEPDAFERGWQAVSPDDHALVVDGDAFTHAQVLTGARSLVQALDVDAGDVVRAALGGAAGWVVGRAVPVLTGATLLLGAGDATVVVSDDAHDLPAPGTSRRRFRRRVTDPGPRHALVIGRNAWTFPGLAGIATGPDGPLPGVTVGIDDDGTVLVRSDSVPRERCDGGWLRTGRSGDVVRGELVIA